MINIEVIKTDDLERIKGGATVSVWTGIIIATVVIFFSGVIEGITNPEVCKQ